MLQVVRGEDGRDVRPEADLHRKVHDVRTGSLDRPVRSRQDVGAGQAIADWSPDAAGDGAADCPLRGGPKAGALNRSGSRRAREQQGAPTGDEWFQPGRVPRIDQEEVPFVAVVQARQRAGEADDHLLDAAPFAADEASVQAHLERSKRLRHSSSPLAPTRGAGISETTPPPVDLRHQPAPATVRRGQVAESEHQPAFRRLPQNPR